MARRPSHASHRARAGAWLAFYNHERPHQALGGWTPAEAYGLATPPWPAGGESVGGDAEATAAASPVALRAPSEAAAATEPDPP